MAVAPPAHRAALTGIGLGMLLAILLAWNGLKVWHLATALQFGDFGSFHRSAVAHLAGQDMYALPPQIVSSGGRTVQVLPSNLNPPHFHFLLLPLALLPPAAALALWGAGSLASLGASLHITLRETAVDLDVPGVIRGTIWLLAFVGTGAVAATGQVSLLLLLPVTLSWAAARKGAWTTAGIYLGLASSVKPFLLIFVPYLLLRRKLGALAAGGGTMLACAATGVAVFGIDSYASWLTHVGAVDWGWQSMNASLRGALSRLLEPSVYFTPLATAPWLVGPLWLVLAAAVGSLTLLEAIRDSSDAAVDRAFALLLLGALLVSPLGWVYYLWLPLGPLVALAARWRRRDAGGIGAVPSAAATWRDRLVIAAIPGLVWPTFATQYFQPSAAATVLPGSIYCWSVLALWLAVAADGAASRAGARAISARSGSARRTGP